MTIRSLVSLCVACVLVLASTGARALDLHQAAKDLGSPDSDKVGAAVSSIAKSSDKAALKLLEALASDSLRIDTAGTPFIAGEGNQLSPVFDGSPARSGAL